MMVGINILLIIIAVYIVKSMFRRPEALFTDKRDINYPYFPKVVSKRTLPVAPEEKEPEVIFK